MRRYIAVHEAGHAVVADALGFEVACIEPAEDGWRVGVVVPEDPTPNEQFLLCAFSLAGGWAQNQAGTPPDAGCGEDLEFAYQHAAHVSEDIDGTMRRAALLAGAILGGRWRVVEKIADRLIDCGSAEGEWLDYALRSDSEGESDAGCRESTTLRKEVLAEAARIVLAHKGEGCGWVECGRKPDVHADELLEGIAAEIMELAQDD